VSFSSSSSPAAPRTDGLDALDRDRAASLADEGGAAGARIQGEEGGDEPPPRLVPFLVGLVAAAGLAAAMLLWLLTTL